MSRFDTGFRDKKGTPIFSNDMLKSPIGFHRVVDDPQLSFSIKHIEKGYIEQLTQEVSEFVRVVG